MHASAVFCVVFISTATAEQWRLKQQTSDWKFHTEQRRVVSLNILQSVNQVSLVGCASFCSNREEIIVPSLFFKTETGQCVCNSVGDTTSEDKSEPKIVYGVRTRLYKTEITDNAFTRTTLWPFKQDCSDLFENLFTKDGVYAIHPPGGSITDTWCDMENGGWTVIQRRMDGSEDFYRGWNDYVKGFGNGTGEYWLGLENMHQLTKDSSNLVVFTKSFYGVKPSGMMARYSNFRIGDVNSKYALQISGFKGACGDSFSRDNGNAFSTFDDENAKERSRNCAEHYQGGWWYQKCPETNLNGFYYQRNEYNHTDPNTHATGIHWYSCWAHDHSLKYSLMKIQRRS